MNDPELYLLRKNDDAPNMLKIGFKHLCPVSLRKLY